MEAALGGEEQKSTGTFKGQWVSSGGVRRELAVRDGLWAQCSEDWEGEEAAALSARSLCRSSRKCV